MWLATAETGFPFTGKHQTDNIGIDHRASQMCALFINTHNQGELCYLKMSLSIQN